MRWFSVLQVFGFPNLKPEKTETAAEFSSRYGPSFNVIWPGKGTRKTQEGSKRNRKGL